MIYGACSLSHCLCKGRGANEGPGDIHGRMVPGCGWVDVKGRAHESSMLLEVADALGFRSVTQEYGSFRI